jgi:mRNA interferase RelE/StbE
MEIEFTASFLRDLKAVKIKSILRKVKALIIELENANNLRDIKNVKYIVDSKIYYRIRIQDHRIGLKYENNKVTLIRCLDRKNIYKKFP